jgi:hypothetical protein
MTTGPAVTRGRLREELAEAQREQHRRRYEADPWAWICETVSTVDELDSRTPIKPFPHSACVPCKRYLGWSHREQCPQCGGTPKPLGYLEGLTRMWHEANPPILIIPKSRRMMMSWTACAWHAWYALYHPHSKVFLVSDRESKSAELLDRCEGLLARLPADKCAPVGMKRTIAPPVLTLDNGAQILGMAEGVDSIRQYTASCLLFDEWGHWKWPRESYAAAKPSIDGGGRLTIVSSAAPGAFAELIRGELIS